LRRRHSRAECERTLRAFAEWREVQRSLHTPEPRHHTLLIIRLDDIGDYLLFRNQLPKYKASARWGSHSITLLGNASWRELFTAFDHGCVDDTLWVNKGEYLNSAPYRTRVWAQLRERGFETVIAPSRTRPLLLDDLCRLAAAPTTSIGAVNTYVHPRWNDLSDGLYGELFSPADPRQHEFHFNGQFARGVCGMEFAGGRPAIDGQTAFAGNVAAGDATNGDLVCFIGANTRSRRWPAKRWIEFIRLYRRRHGGKVILAGNGSAEQDLALRIQAQTGSQSIVGKVSLLELTRLIMAARAVVSNDTMAAHLAVSCSRPTVIVANGVNYERFTDYDRAGISGVATVYPEVFIRRRERHPSLAYRYTDALTADMASIRAEQVIAGLDDVLMTRAVAKTA
jgi:ADP-heptose:LPS heptosyltransferase